jgi:hypothetical protein
MSMLSTLLKTYYAEQMGIDPEEDLRRGHHALHGQEVRGGAGRAPHAVGRALHGRGAHDPRADLDGSSAFGVDFHNLPDGMFDSAGRRPPARRTSSAPPAA